jgi:hypothetical protein
MYMGRDPRPFLQALAQLRRQRGAGHRPVHAAFLGRNTGGAFDLEAEVRQHGLAGAVHLGGQVPYGQSLRDMARADVLLLLDSPGRRVGVPAKLYEYLGAGRPILALAEPDGDTAWVLRQSGVAHRLAPPGAGPANAGPIRDALVALVDEVEAGAPAPPPERLFAFTREHMAQQIAALLDGCLAPGPAPVPAAPRAEEVAAL